MMARAPAGYLIGLLLAVLVCATGCVPESTDTASEGKPPAHKHHAKSEKAPTKAKPKRKDVPTIVGRSQRAATNILRNAGFKVKVREATRASGRDRAVLSQSPRGTAHVKPGSMVSIVVSHVVQPVAPPPVSRSCTPGYSPCLPPASDYDCAGGSGDGPKYTGLVHITGYDIYDLDRDGDGLGCD